VTAAVSTNDRADGFDYRIYHRSFSKQERLYLEQTAIEENEPKRETLLGHLMELLCYQRNRMTARTKNDLAVELIDAMEAVERAVALPRLVLLLPMLTRSIAVYSLLL
jgi:hypothetical protein